MKPSTRGRIRSLGVLCCTTSLWLFVICLSSSSGLSESRTAPSRPLFREVSAEVGLKFHHFTGATGEFYAPEIVGPGVALFDYDNDGDLDVYLVQGTILAPGKTLRDALFPPPAGWKEGNRLFKNLLVENGKLEFVDVTEQAGVGLVSFGMGVAVGDYDNDEFQDLYVTNFGPNVLYHNNGNGTFREVTREANVDDPRWSSGAAWVDYDRDGYLDLFVANYVDFTTKGNKRFYAANGEPDYGDPAYSPVPSRLFRNLGNGKFNDVTEEAGIGATFGSGLGVICGDFNRDGWPDIYVANDSQANILWLNQGDGTFKDVALLAGAAYNAEGMPQAGMGVAGGDFDGDGDEDIVVTNLNNQGCVLYRNDGSGYFYDATAEVGLLQATQAFTGWGVGWLDYDNDGGLDLFVANGAIYLLESLRGKSRYPYNQLNQLFHNEGHGQRFREMTGAAGPAFELSEVSRGAAFGDLDNDGDVDVVVVNNNGPARLLLNETNPRLRRHWLEIRLTAAKGNKFGIGARVELQQAGRKLARRVGTEGSYASASDVRVHFGLGENPQVDAVTVQWPDGSRETWEKVRADRIVELREGTGRGQ